MRDESLLASHEKLLTFHFCEWRFQIFVVILGRQRRIHYDLLVNERNLVCLSSSLNKPVSVETQISFGISFSTFWATEDEDGFQRKSVNIICDTRKKRNSCWIWVRSGLEVYHCQIMVKIHLLTLNTFRLIDFVTSLSPLAIVVELCRLVNRLVVPCCFLKSVKFICSLSQVA